MLYSSFFCVCLRGLSVKFSWCFQVLYTFADWLCGLVKHNNLPILSLFVTSCLLFSVLSYVLLRNPCGVVAGSSQKTVILGRSPQGGCNQSGRKLYDYMSDIPLIFCIRSLSVSSRVFFFSSYPNTILTFHSTVSSCAVFRRSISILSLIFFVQNCVLVFGTTKYLQPWCPCQKKQFTKILVLYFLQYNIRFLQNFSIIYSVSETFFKK